MLEDGRGQQAGLAAAAKRLHDRMAIAQRIEAELRAIDQGAEPGGQDVRPPCPALPRRAQLAVVLLGQHLVAEKEHQVAAALEIGVQHAGLAGGELGHVAEEHAVVPGQVAIHHRAFRGHLGLHQGVVGRSSPAGPAPRPGSRRRRGRDGRRAARRCTTRGSPAAPAPPENGDCRRPGRRRGRGPRSHDRPACRNGTKTRPTPFRRGRCPLPSARPAAGPPTVPPADVGGPGGRSSSTRPPVARCGRRSSADRPRGGW